MGKTIFFVAISIIGVIAFIKSTRVRIIAVALLVTFGPVTIFWLNSDAIMKWMPNWIVDANMDVPDVALMIFLGQWIVYAIIACCLGFNYDDASLEC